MNINITLSNRPWTSCTILISLLRITSQLQRPVDPRKVDRILQDFIWRKVQIVSVGRYPDGTLAVADGQHTCLAIQKKFGDMPVDCEITDVADDEEFRQLVDECNPPIATKPTQRDRFWMDYAVKKPYTVEIIELANVGGLETVPTATCAQHVNCVTTLVRLWRTQGVSRLRDIFLFYRDALENGRAHDYVLEGVSLFLEYCGDDPAFVRDKVVREIRKAVFTGLIRQTEQAAKADRITKSKAFARVLKATFNEQIGRRGKHIKAEIP